MTDDPPFHSPNLKPRPARQSNPGERLFTFNKGIDEFVCDLRDHGLCIEAQFLLNGQLYVAHTFWNLPEFGKTARELAIAWAEHQRADMERR
jgi:hypothetical protein